MAGVDWKNDVAARTGHKGIDIKQALAGDSAGVDFKQVLAGESAGVDWKEVVGEAKGLSGVDWKTAIDE
jgi:hypothetical protein